MTDSGARFVGTNAEAYHRFLGPMFFGPYARDLATRVARHAPESVLEIACGTGIVTIRLADALPDAAIVATDLNQPMIDFARGVVPAHPQLSWQQADACALPFPDGVFDAVVMQFGIMFVPDKLLALQEARRVLRAGGRMHFNVWDRVEANPSAGATMDTSLSQRLAPSQWRRMTSPLKRCISISTGRTASPSRVSRTVTRYWPGPFALSASIAVTSVRLPLSRKDPRLGVIFSEVTSATR